MHSGDLVNALLGSGGQRFTAPSNLFLSSDCLKGKSIVVIWRGQTFGWVLLSEFSQKVSPGVIRLISSSQQSDTAN